VARAWLAERLKGTVEEIVGGDKIALARIQALTSPAPTDPRIAAMLAEVAGRSSENLILLSETELERLRVKAKGAALIENYIWRTAILTVPFVLALIFLTQVLDWFGNRNPSAKTLAGLATVLTVWVSLVVVGTGRVVLKRVGRDPGLLELIAGAVFAVGPALVVLFLYPS
jgi:hypothetical protein